MPGASDSEKLWRRGRLHGIRASLERDRVRVTLGTSGMGKTARLETVAPETVDNVTPLVEGRLRNGRVGLLDKDEDRSLSSGEFLKLDGYLSRVAAHMDRFKCQLIASKECKLTSMPKPTVGCSRRSSVGTCVEVLVVNCRPGFARRSSGVVLHKSRTYRNGEDYLHLKLRAIRNAKLQHQHWLLWAHSRAVWGILIM